MSEITYSRASIAHTNSSILPYSSLNCWLVTTCSFGLNDVLHLGQRVSSTFTQFVQIVSWQTPIIIHLFDNWWLK